MACLPRKLMALLLLFLHGAAALLGDGLHSVLHCEHGADAHGASHVCHHSHDSQRHDSPGHDSQRGLEAIRSRTDSATTASTSRSHAGCRHHLSKASAGTATAPTSETPDAADAHGADRFSCLVAEHDCAVCRWLATLRQADIAPPINAAVEARQLISPPPIRATAVVATIVHTARGPPSV